MFLPGCADAGSCKPVSPDPLSLDLVDAAQQELLEAHRLLVCSEHRFYRLLAESITGAVLGLRHLLAHGCNPVRANLPLRPRCCRRTEIVSTPPFSRRRRQHLYAALFQLRHLTARGVAVVRQHPLCRTHRRRDRVHHEMRQIVLRLLLPHVYRQQIQLRLITLCELRHQTTPVKGLCLYCRTSVSHYVRQAVKEKKVLCDHIPSVSLSLIRRTGKKETTL